MLVSVTVTGSYKINFGGCSWVFDIVGARNRTGELGVCRVFCGEFPTQGCVQQMHLFAVASVIPAALALVLMVAAFTAPSLSGRPTLRARTLGFSLLAWLIAAATFVLGGLPAI